MFTLANKVMLIAYPRKGKNIFPLSLGRDLKWGYEEIWVQYGRGGNYESIWYWNALVFMYADRHSSCLALTKKGAPRSLFSALVMLARIVKVKLNQRNSIWIAKIWCWRKHTDWIITFWFNILLKQYDFSRGKLNVNQSLISTARLTITSAVFCHDHYWHMWYRL